jgi:hypothetical protein
MLTPARIAAIAEIGLKARVMHLMEVLDEATAPNPD